MNPILADLLRYDEWATRLALEPVLQLTDEQLVQEFAGELSSIRQQCHHLISVPNRYRARILGEPVPDVDPTSLENPEQIVAYAAEVADRFAQMVASLAPERLDDEMRYDTRRGLFVATVEQTLMHVVNHGTYHRGQIACLLKLHGVEPVDTDYLIWTKYR
jgi:uncharacterized damage-inducible protein DinB